MFFLPWGINGSISTICTDLCNYINFLLYFTKIKKFHLKLVLENIRHKLQKNSSIMRKKCKKTGSI